MEQVKTITWLVPFQPKSLSDISTCSLASVRLRAATLLGAIRKDDNLALQFASSLKSLADLLVVGKVGGDCVRTGRDRLWLSAINKQIVANKPVTIDYTDNHMDCKTVMTEFYSQIPRHPLVHWVVPSPWMANSLRRKSIQNIHLIDDAVEVPLRCAEPRTVRPSGELSGLWFGHPSNFQYLDEFLRRQASSGVSPFSLWVISSGLASTPGISKLKNLAIVSDVCFHPWSLDALVNLSFKADFCLIPGCLDDPKKAGVGINRLATALALGMPTFASPYSSYAPLKDYYCPISAGEVKITVEKVSSLLSSMRGDLPEVLRGYAHSVIGRVWLNFFKTLVGLPERAC